ncbi:molybdopterin synthase sulfur carrier subunit [Halopenitus malekzadehii]|uniref:Molybdopterin synthase sulfur carrier subunit n=1 Tax=Halopenitus malekzadehii TaxID=1267564 RepID=A0A1H6ILE9_9EURY|nr:molybdopterin synthase sulfur carrier subunit [Halopenitus malekzadehii]
MELELRFFATFREAAGSKTVHYEVDGDDVIVGDVLAALEEDYEGMRGRLIEDGALAPQINVLKNGREVLHIQGLETPLSAGDTLSIFPPVAGGIDEVPEGADETDATDRRERSYRGISRRLAAHYLRNLGGTLVGTDDPVEATRVEGDGWTAELSADTVAIGGSLTLTEVTIGFTGDPSILDDLIERFSQKAMRAGG